MKRRPRLVLLVLALVATLVPAVVSQLGAGASVFPDSTEVTYKEYWIPHSQFSGGCHGTTAPLFYAEPGPCEKTLTLNIPDDFSSALKTVLYVDLWRAGRASGPAARYQINGGVVRTATVGNEFSRSPMVVELPKSTFRQGSNTFTFSAVPVDARYHIHDVVVRIYHDDTHPLVPGPGSDVTPPTGALVDVGGIAASSGGTVNVDSDQLTLRATATGAQYVDFLGYYDGYDEDIDGFTLDWHGQYHNNWGPGGISPKPSGATHDHVGTDTTPDGSGFYSVTWNLPDVPNQSNVRFKIRAVDASGNVREAPGGISGGFNLTRSVTTEVFRVAGFEDVALHHRGDFPDFHDYQIDLPDLTNVQSAYLIGQHWQNPFVSVNGNTPFKAFNSTCESCGEDIWSLSKRSLNVNHLVPGANTLRYSHNPQQSQFGSFVEKPGPMVILRRSTGSGAPVITRQPASVAVPEGTPVTLSVNTRGATPMTYQWQRNGVPVPGATGPALTLPAVNAAENGSAYRVVVSNGSGSVTSAVATLTVAGAGEWWNQQWGHRLPILVAANGYARTDGIVEAAVSFTDAFSQAGAPGTLDPESIRVVEVNAAGTVVDAEILSQFDPVEAYDATSNARGTLIFRLEGATAAGANRIFHVYFDTPAAGIGPQGLAPLVSVTDDTNEGDETFRIDTPTATWQYQKNGASLSSVLDPQGNDWMGYNPSTSPSGAHGAFRGLPNFPYPEGHFHPGFTSADTVLRSAGPLRVVLESESDDGIWSYRTSFYPTHATSNVLKIDSTHKYWFLYEGTPGGAIGSEDVVVRSTGQQTAINTSWNGDLVGDEWTAIGDTVKNRAFFLSNDKDDGFVDSYFLLDNAMTVLGYGRSNVGGVARMSIDEPGGQYSFGLVDGTAFNTVRPAVLSRYKPLVVTPGRGQRDLGPELTAQLSAISVVPSATGATISWTSSPATSGSVEHGPTASYGSTIDHPAMTTAHTVTITDLPCETPHHFRIHAVDGAGRTVDTPDASFVTSDCTALPALTGDDFSPSPLNEDVWSVVDPVGDSTISTDGSDLVLDLPAGADHDHWANAPRGVRVMQPVTDLGNGTWEVKLNAAPRVNSTFTGLLFEESPTRWVRVDALFTASRLRIFAGRVAGTTGTGTHTLIPNQAGPLWIRVTKTGSTWQASWSSNGTTFTNVPAFTFALNPTAVGVFAGAKGASPSTTPAFVSRIDYVQDNAAPVADDAADSTVPSVTGVGFAAGPDSVKVRFTTDEPARGRVVTGTAEDPVVIDGPVVTRHEITVPDLDCSDQVPVVLSAVDRAGNEQTTVSISAITASCGTVLQSDEMNGETLAEHWKVFSPVGDVGPAQMTGTNAIIDLPAGTAHDLVAPFSAHRLLQYAPDGDLHIEAKWETLPHVQFQSQGVIVQAGIQDFLRFETYHNGAQLRLYAATVVGGTLTTRLDVPLTANGGVTLRVRRSGDTWTLSHQVPAGALTQSAQFVHGMAVSNAGVFVMNSHPDPTRVPHFAASLDYFRNLDQPAPADDVDTTAPVISNLVVTPAAAHAYVRWNTNEPASSRVDYGATSAYGTVKQSANRLLHHEVILSPLTCGRTYHYKATSVDAAGLSSTGGDLTFETSPCPEIQSDSFNGTSLNGQWRYIDPKGDVTGPIMTGTAVGMNLPAGVRHDMWQAALEAPRLLQAAPNTDFQIAARWATAPTQNTQSEGMLVMQDPTNFVRFDIYSDGSQTRAFAATFLNASPTVRANVAIPSLPGYRQRITRTGNNFNLQWSADGVTWNNVANFNYTLGVNDVGVFATNTNAGGSPPAWQPRLDAFDNTASPSEPDDVSGPVISDIAVTQGGAQATVTWTTDEPASSKVEFGSTASYGAVSQNAALVTSHSLEMGPITCGHSYHFRITSIDAATNGTTTADQTFDANPCAGGVVSDAFSSPTLHSRWTFVNPVGDVPPPVMTGTDVRFDLPAGVSHDQWTNNLKAVQLIQSVPNGDFEIEAKWNSALTKQYQFQGIIVRADANNFIRFDAVRTGSTTQNAFAASFVNGVATQRASVPTTITAPMFQRVGRVGNTWTYKISPNGTTWTTVATFTHTLNVSAVGAFAGNHHPTPSKVPALSASLDWFHNTSNPLPDDTTVVSGQLENDDFSAGFNDARWDFVDPRDGDATLQVVWGEAVISVPGGSGHDHDAFHEWLTVPRLEQRIDDVDFETEVKFSSFPSLSTPNQMQGVLVRESDSRWARFDVTTSNDHLVVYSATWDGTSFVQRARKFIKGGSSLLLRVRRVGDVWTYSYAYDDLHWTPVISYTFPMTVETVGPFIGNVPVTGQPFSTTPPFTGRIDYVFNRALPPTSEDGGAYPPTAIAPVIDVWYGDIQTFGAIGKPQQWVNIVGDVADFDGVTSLAYSLNGGAMQPLSMGETENRLAEPGDFNAEIDWALLNPGANSLLLRATDAMGNVTNRTVTIDNAYTGQAWPTTYSIDWSTAPSIGAVAQIADGQWRIEGNSIRTVGTGYDRTIVVGDNAWDRYEAVVDVTIHSMHPRDNGVGIVAGWRGATTDNYGVPNPQQPRIGHPFPGLGWYSKEIGRQQRLNIYRNFGGTWETRLAEHPTYQLTQGLTYTFKLRVEPIDATTAQYSLKVWEAGTSEPTHFQVTAASARQGGSIVLATHRMDVSFGGLTVTALP